MFKNNRSVDLGNASQDEGACDDRPQTDFELAFTQIIKDFVSYDSDTYELLGEEELISLSDLKTHSGMNIWNEANRLLSGDMPFEVALRQIMEEVGKFFGACSGYVFLFGPHSFEIAWAAEKDYSFPIGFENPTKKALDEWGELLKDDAHIFIPDTSDERVPIELRAIWQKCGIKRSHNTPIFIDGKLTGLLCFDNISKNTSQVFIVDMLTKSIGHAFRRFELEEYSRRLRFQDALTGYLNFDGFKQIAEERLKNEPNNNYALWYCDIRRFKYINDIFGYKIGDDFLKYWLDSINEHIGINDTFGRISGDNVTIFTQYNDLSEVESLFTAIADSLSVFPGLQDKNFKAEMICGVYLLEKQDVAEGDINKMLNWANIAQKSVKNLSGSRIALYDEEIRNSQLRELQISQHLEVGLSNGEFYINCQPQYNYATGELVGAEALVRWSHPQLGLVSPGEFIPLLERAGLITDLDFYVWEETCKFMRFLLDNGDAFAFVPLSVNISRVDIYIPNLSDRFLELVKKYDLTPEMLRLEITESAYMADSDQLIEVVNSFQEAGFTVEMDDFGSGYSSLNSLKEVSVDVLKLDMRFLSGGYDTDRGRNILRSVVSMARGLDLSVIAEGVETKEQADFLLSIGCEVMQGYYFSKPVSLTAFMMVLRKAAVGNLSVPKA